MSRRSDYEDEMSDTLLTDEVIEAFVLGLPHPAWQQDERLVALATDVGAAMDAAPPTPDHALLQLFWTGIPGGGADAGAGAPVPEPAAAAFAPRRWRRLVVSVAAGMAAVTVGIGAAGATGALPAPAQRVVARVVEAVSPFQLAGPWEEAPDGSSRNGRAVLSEGSGTQTPGTAVETTTTSSRSGAATAPSAAGAKASPVAGVAPDATGRGWAADTPAAGSVPPALPQRPTANGVPATDGGATQSTGADRAQETSAGTAVPPSPPVPSRPGPRTRP